MNIAPPTAQRNGPTAEQLATPQGQKAWKAARKDIMNIPSVEGLPDDHDKDGAPKK